MVDPDISTADALRLLSTPVGRGDDRLSVSRRHFLQGVGAGLGGVMIGGVGLPGMPGWDRHWADAAPVGPTDGIVVIIGMFGGNDGLRTVAPVGSSHYARLRPRVRVQPNQALMLNGELGLAPELPGLKARWDAGQVAIVQGCGYANPDLSHFQSMAYWMSGRPNGQGGAPTTGWMGRWLDGQPTPDIFRAVTVGYSIPLHMQGSEVRAVGVPPWGPNFGTATGEQHDPAYAALDKYANQPVDAGPWMKAIGTNVRNTLTVARSVAPVFDEDQGPFPDDELGRKMVVAARLINADLGIRVLDMGYGDFDHHSDETTGHPDRMRELDGAITSFFATLAPQWRNRVTIMTFSEFGRTPFDNDSNGTDHGTSHPMLLIGDGVRGGLYGEHPDLAAMVNDWDRMETTVDFRSVYASVLDGWLGGGSSDVLGGSFEDLRLFRTGPGGAAAVAPQLRVQGDLVTTPPTRIFDTASGTGLPVLTRKLNPGEMVTLQVAGRGGVPAMAQANVADVPVAVLLHVTASAATAPSDLTVWASDDPRPGMFCGPVRVGATEPMVVVSRLGADGKVTIRNRAGQCHVRVDVAGWFRGSAAQRLSVVAPRVLRDTSAGVGGPAGRVRTIDVTVTGGKVPSGATSAVLNVTTTSAAADGSVTVWPKGAAKPGVAAGPVIAAGPARRLVVTPIGAGGAVSIASTSLTHVRVEVLGWFGPAGTSRQVANEPFPVLDTRTGIGRPAGRIGTAPITFDVTGIGDVPGSKVAAVLLEVTASAASSPGHLTAWRNGTDKPKVVNLTSRTDRPVTNLVLVRPDRAGLVRLANSAGQVHVRADVIAWYRAI